MIVAIIEILASLGLFLFGMLYLEERIKTASGRSFKKMINNATRTNIRSLSLGFTTTALFQSSSVVSLMTLSLIGAGTLSLQNGIGIIFGSNIGTTATSWIIALIGFKFDIQLLAYSIIAIGGIGSIIVERDSNWKHYFGGMVGFGLIFIGLEGMKEGFSFISKDFDLTNYKQLDLYLFFFIGIILTAIIQSSSASIAIAQSALFTQLISFEMAALFIIGSNVGTTVTIFLGSIGGSPDKKRAAAVHFLFNLSTAIVALILISPLTTLTFLIIPLSEPIIALALFHTVFNVLGVLLWFFWIPQLARLLEKRFTKEPLVTTKYIHTVSPDVSVVALESLEQEVHHLIKKVSEFSLLAINILPPQALEKHHGIDKLLDQSKEPLDISYTKLYKRLQELEGEIYDYALAISLHITEEEQKRLQQLTNIATRLASASKAIKDMLHDLDTLSHIEISDVEHFYHNIRYQILNSILIFHSFLKGEDEDLEKMKNSFRKIDKSYKSTLDSISSIAQNPGLSKKITTIVVNDVHLTRRFTKNLYKSLQELEGLVQKEEKLVSEDEELNTNT